MTRNSSSQVSDPGPFDDIWVRKASPTRKIEARLALIVQEAKDARFTGTYSLKIHCKDGGIGGATVVKEESVRI